MAFSSSVASRFSASSVFSSRMAAILSRAFSCRPPCPIRWASVIRKSREGLSSGSMSMKTLPAEGSRSYRHLPRLVVFHLLHRHQFVQQVGEPLRRLLQLLLQPVLLPEFRQHRRVVAAPVRQNQAAEAVVVVAQIPSDGRHVLSQPARVYL